MHTGEPLFDTALACRPAYVPRISEEYWNKCAGNLRSYLNRASEIHAAWYDNLSEVLREAYLEVLEKVKQEIAILVLLAAPSLATNLAISLEAKARYKEERITKLMAVLDTGYHSGASSELAHLAERYLLTKELAFQFRRFCLA